MDIWKFFDITHRDHVVCNPTSLQRLDDLIGLLDLPANPAILDVGSGKGEFLLRTVERYGGVEGAGVRAVAIDASPFAVAELRAAASKRVPRADLEILEQDAATYRPAPATFDLACCLGASFAFEGYRGTLAALEAAARPGGQILVGEPFWWHDPDEAYLESSGLRRDEFGTHAGNVAVAVEAGLVPLLAFVSGGEEWDRYETLQWRAAARYAAAHPEDPDVSELVERETRARHEYLSWGRETVGWAMYLFGKPVS